MENLGSRLDPGVRRDDGQYVGDGTPSTTSIDDQHIVIPAEAGIHLLLAGRVQR